MCRSNAATTETHRAVGDSSGDAVTVQSLNVYRGEVAERRQVLYNCNLQIPRGQLWMILGRNGSGKSTLLKALAGLLPIQNGQRTMDQPCGYVFQDPNHQVSHPADLAKD